MPYCNDIKPDTLHWWWTVKPILNKKKPHGKGKRFNATGSYQIMVRAFIIVTYLSLFSAYILALDSIQE